MYSIFIRNICTYTKCSTFLHLHTYKQCFVYAFIHTLLLFVNLYCWYPHPVGTLDDNTVVIELDGCLSGPSGIAVHTDTYVRMQVLHSYVQ